MKSSILGSWYLPEKILDEAIKQNVDAIGLSGLITPSLDEMVSSRQGNATKKL